MIDLRLVALTESDLAAALPFARGIGPDNAPCWIMCSHQYALDPFGPAINKPAVIDGAGNVVTPADVDNNFHANLRLIDESLAAQVPETVIVTPDPNSPSRVWQGS